MSRKVVRIAARGVVRPESRRLIQIPLPMRTRSTRHPAARSRLLFLHISLVLDDRFSLIVLYTNVHTYVIIDSHRLWVVIFFCFCFSKNKFDRKLCKFHGVFEKKSRPLVRSIERFIMDVRETKTKQQQKLK